MNVETVVVVVGDATSQVGDAEEVGQGEKVVTTVQPLEMGRTWIRLPVGRLKGYYSGSCKPNSATGAVAVGTTAATALLHPTNTQPSL